MKYNLYIKSSNEEDSATQEVEGLTQQQTLVISRFLEANGMICTASAWEDDFETMCWSGLARCKVGDLPGMLGKPRVITADGVEVCAVMSLEDLYRLAGQAPKSRQPVMMRREGVMFREVVLGR